MKTKLPVLLLSILIISCNTSVNNKTNENTKIGEVELSMDENANVFLSDSSINALSIGIFKNGKSYIKHYGEIDKGKENNPTDNTIYEIASISKTFAGTLVAQAELEGKLNLDDDIRQYLEGDYSNLSYEGNPIRIKDLITHTSRLPTFLPVTINELFINPDDSLAFKVHQLENEYSQEQFLIDLKSINIDTIPGTRNQYSNADTELIAHILETVYGISYNQLIQEKICSKLEMQSTGTILPERLKPYLANGYTMNNVSAPYMSKTLWGAGGGMMSSIPDMIKYIAFQLDNENELATKTHHVIYENGQQQIAYYWPVQYDEQYGTYYRHHGGAFGTQSLLFILPQKDLGIIVITNQSFPDTAQKLSNIMNGILDDL